jgi:hypothetical protein
MPAPGSQAVSCCDCITQQAAWVLAGIRTFMRSLDVIEELLQFNGVNLNGVVTSCLKQVLANCLHVQVEVLRRSHIITQLRRVLRARRGMLLIVEVIVTDTGLGDKVRLRLRYVLRS